MEQLAGALGYAGAGRAVQPGKGGADEPGLGRQIAGQPHGTHAPAVGSQRQGRGEAVLRRAGGQLGVVVQLEHLQGEGRLVGQHAGGIVVDVQTVGGLLDHHAAPPVSQQPVELGRRQPRQKGVVGDADALQQPAGLVHPGAAAQQPRDQLELRHAAPLRRAGAVDGAGHEVQPGDAQPLLVHRVVVQGIARLHRRHADHGVVLCHLIQMAHGQRKAPGRDGDALAEAALIVEIAPEEEMVGQIGGRSTHKKTSCQGLSVGLLGYCRFRKARKCRAALLAGGGVLTAAPSRRNSGSDSGSTCTCPS